MISFEKDLRFASYQPNDILQKNRYGILEPDDKAFYITPQQLDLVIMPLLAVDLFGHRLGSGGGYYDRTFSYLRNSLRIDRKPILMGLAYSIQFISNVPADPWDVSLHAVLTEEKITFCLSD